MNILFVCTGNTCRSPMAEGYLNSKSKNCVALSCGICADGSPVSENSKKAMAEVGIDISNHISQPITEKLVNWADRIICMSYSHKSALESLGIKSEVLGDGVSDPFGGDIFVYRKCRDEIIAKIDNLFLSFEIVPVEYAHISQIAVLEKVCFSTPWSEQSIIDSFKAGTKFFVAENGGSVLGYVGISAIAGQGYITNIAVFPEYRNHGVATALLLHLFEFAETRNLEFISLEVRESNYTAIQIYKKLGFVKEGRRKNFYSLPTEDALILTKRFD